MASDVGILSLYVEIVDMSSLASGPFQGKDRMTRCNKPLAICVCALSSGSTLEKG